MIDTRALSHQGFAGGGPLFFALRFFSDGFGSFVSGESPDGFPPGAGGDLPDEPGDFFPDNSFGFFFLAGESPDGFTPEAGSDLPDELGAFFLDDSFGFFFAGESLDGFPSAGGGDLPDELGDFFPDTSFDDLAGLVCSLPEAFRDVLPALSLPLTTAGIRTGGSTCCTGGASGTDGGGCSFLDLGGDPSDLFLYLVASGIQHSRHDPQRKKNTKAVALKYVPCSVVHSAVSSSKLAVP